VVENNMDGQLAMILRNELPDLATRLVSLAKCDGMPLSARWITEQIAAVE
jgi:2-oxoglutarate ferredoxin oxidoreductase subunit alpha